MFLNGSPGSDRDGGRGRGREPGGGKVGHKLPEFTGRQPARMEVLAEVRHQRVTAADTRLLTVSLPRPSQARQGSG